jgi:hypothetical protein
VVEAVEVADIRHLIRFSLLIRKGYMLEVELITVEAIVEITIVVLIDKRSLRRPAILARPAKELAVSSEMTAPSQVMVTVAT